MYYSSEVTNRIEEAILGPQEFSTSLCHRLTQEQDTAHSW